MGTVSIPMDSIADKKSHDRWYVLGPRKGETASGPLGEVHMFSLYTPSTTRVSVDDFDLLTVIGKGSFGKVMQVRKKDSGRIYAMKVLRKEAIVERDEVGHTRSEKNILGHIQHPFIVGLKYSFQTAEKLYLVMDYINGGELFFHLKKEKRFSEDRVRIYAAEIVSALAHLHKYDVIYRDLKPENILLDMSGHICLTDFGLCKEGIGEGRTTNTFCGTPEYLAPEVLKGCGYDKAVDWWSLGILMYEMLTGLPPFYSQNVNVMYEKILNEKLRFPSHIETNARDLLSGLLARDPKKRLGGSEDDAGPIMAHPFFAKLDWAKVVGKEIVPPFKPDVSSITDSHNFDKEFTAEPPVDSYAASNNLTKAAAQQFENFTYVAPDEHLAASRSK